MRIVFYLFLRRYFLVCRFLLFGILTLFFPLSFFLYTCQTNYSDNRDVSISDAKCINRTGLYITYTVLNSISTWWILLMPMPIILSLALKNQQKMLLCSLFALGSLPCVTSIARLKVLVDWLHTGHNENDITFQLWSIVMWT
jgi:hypothetical protein